MSNDPTEHSLDQTLLAALKIWKQGDILEPGDFVWLAPLASSAIAGHTTVVGQVGENTVLASRFDRGLVVVTPTCDMYPRGRPRPHVAVVPLVHLEGDDAQMAHKRRLTRFVYVPGAQEPDCFADLDRIMTIETGALARASRVPGLTTDQERRTFAAGLPDELQDTLRPWKEKVVEPRAASSVGPDTHDRPKSPEGQIFAAAEDIRVEADPSWAAKSISVTVHLVMPSGWLPDSSPDAIPSVKTVEDLAAKHSADIASLLLEASDPDQRLELITALQDKWSQTCPASGAIDDVAFVLVGEDEMTHLQISRSESLDLEFLSPIQFSD